MHNMLFQQDWLAEELDYNLANKYRGKIQTQSTRHRHPLRQVSREEKPRSIFRPQPNQTLITPGGYGKRLI